MTAPFELADPDRGRALPPFSEDAEVAVLASMLLEEAAILQALEGLDETMFYREAHRRVFRAIVDVHQRGDLVDPISVGEALERVGALQSAGGREYLGVLMFAVPTAANVSHYIAIVRDRAVRRRLIVLAETARQSAADLSVSTDAVSDEIARALVPIATRARTAGFRNVAELVWPFLEHVEHLANPARHVGVLTGYPELDDKLFGGFQPGEFIILCGVPNSGKTAVLLNFLLNPALDAGVHTALVSAEMTTNGVLGRILANLAGLSATKFRKGDFTPAEHRTLAGAAGTLRRLPIALDDTPMPDLEDVVAKIRLLKAKDPELRVVGVDFIQLLQARAERGELGESILRRISYGLKGLALELGLTVVATCQPNDKQIEDREDKRPTLRDLQGSSGMRQAADIVMLLYRPGQYSHTANAEIELNAPKARDLPAFRVTLGWDGSHQRVTSRGREIVERNKHELTVHGRQEELQ